ncbi:hypothetical protein LG651_14585 [Tamlana sp. 62-3]|uniref:Uncharacterized protein n=1 Tax=Neotamlana sargassicola TaxID=2883125 RepID=A0A9X1L5U6_9FLAO|nr:hypothetical protein [Tamlana sargassicola]MCB4809480.1 hypothetical protein [Tamlana sargassicola]
MSFNGFSQVDTIYVDENYNKLLKDTFKQKLESNAYEGYRYSTDTLVLEMLKVKFRFGNLDKDIKSQLFKLLFARHSIDTSKVLSILYIDSLKSKNDFPKKKYALVQDLYGNTIGKEKFRSASVFPSEYVDIRKYLKDRNKNEIRLVTEYNYKGFLKNCKRFFSFHKKYDEVTPFIFYNFNAGTEDEFKEINAYKDYGQLLRKLFALDTEVPKYIVIKNNGEFYASHLMPYLFFNEKDWERTKNKYFNKIKANSQNL